MHFPSMMEGFWQQRPSIPTQSPPRLLPSSALPGLDGNTSPAPILADDFWMQLLRPQNSENYSLQKKRNTTVIQLKLGHKIHLPNQKTAGHSIKLTWWQNPDLHSHTIDCNEDIAAITLADKSLHIIYMYVNGTEWKSSQVKEMLKKPCKPA